MNTMAKRLMRRYEVMKKAGSDQSTLEEESNVSQGYISQLLNGKRDDPSAYRLSALCRAMGITMEYALYGDGVEEEYERLDLEQALLSAFRALTNEQQPIAVSVIRSMRPPASLRKNDTGSSTDDLSLVTPPNDDPVGSKKPGSKRKAEQGRHGKNTSVQLQKLDKKTRQSKPKT